ncbi:MAG: ABC transporter substrate-binding protein, partial [Actinomycetota bacterium]
VEYLGRVFDREAAADQVVGRLKERVESTRASLEGAPQRTAAVLFPTVSGGSGFAYGIKSMAHPQLEAAGFTNVFGDVNDRVFEVTTEELINRNPEVLILLYVGGDPDAVKNAITSLPGADRMKAVQDDAILVQLFNFSEPPTPLVLDGLERIAEHFSEGT